MADFGKLNFSVSFNPTSAFPLDARCYFESLTAAQAAAAKAEEAGSTNTVYYIGQKLLVVEGGKATWYTIQPNKSLLAEGTGTGSDDDNGSGEPGEDGGYYTPLATQIDADTMKLSFAASKADMPAVPDVEITLPAGPQGIPGNDGKSGEKGDPGKTPTRGVDYWTAEDQQAIVNAVMSNFTDVSEVGM